MGDFAQLPPVLDILADVVDEERIAFDGAVAVMCTRKVLRSAVTLGCDAGFSLSLNSALGKQSTGLNDTAI